MTQVKHIKEDVRAIASQINQDFNAQVQRAQSVYCQQVDEIYKHVETVQSI